MGGAWQLSPVLPILVVVDARCHRRFRRWSLISHGRRSWVAHGSSVLCSPSWLSWMPGVRPTSAPAHPTTKSPPPISTTTRCGRNPPRTPASRPTRGRPRRRPTQPPSRLRRSPPPPVAAETPRGRLPRAAPVIPRENRRRCHAVITPWPPVGRVRHRALSGTGSARLRSFPGRTAAGATPLSPRGRRSAASGIEPCPSHVVLLR